MVRARLEGVCLKAVCLTRHTLEYRPATRAELERPCPRRRPDREVTPYGPRMDPEVTPKFSVKIVKISVISQISPARSRAAEVTWRSR